MTPLTKTGEVLDRDESGQLWLCESWLDEETQETTTTRTEWQDPSEKPVAQGDE
jgi:hypothetical protein